jgi:ABC-type tungstate transport system substrate-binding protein
MILAAILMGVVCQGILAIMQVEEAPSKWLLVRSLMSVIACGSVVYGLSLYLLQAPGKRKLLWAGIREIFIKKV